MAARLDPSASARLAALKREAVELTQEEERLLERLQELRSSLARNRDQVRAVERSQTRTRRELPEETWRRTVRELGTFTLSELATELGCTQPTAKRHLAAMECMKPPMVQPAGRLGGKLMWEYVQPDSPGEAFLAQQRMMDRPAPEVVAVAGLAPERSNQDLAQSRIGSVSDKQIRAVVREAVANGWRLVHTGKSGHSLRLVRGSDTVTVVSTPRNSGDAANTLRQRLGLRGSRAA